MKPRILLTGATGQVGSELAVVLPTLDDVIAPNRRLLDLAKPDGVARTIREIRPQLIVNAAAYTAVDRAEKEASIAWAVNAEAPAVMAQEAKKIGAGILHYMSLMARSSPLTLKAILPTRHLGRSFASATESPLARIGG